MKKMLALLIATLLLFPLVAFADAKDTYNQAQELLAQSKYSEAAKLFEIISTYEDASKLAMYCKACALCESGYFDMGITAFEALGEYKDCPMRITYYQARATEYVAGESDWIAMEAALAAYSTIPVFLDSFERIMALNTRIETAKTTDYNAALALMQAGRYEEAIEAFRELRGYKDVSAQIKACETAILDDKYDAAIALMDAGKYTEAIATFTAIKTHKDSETKIKACETAILNNKYDAAVALKNAGKYNEAYDAFVVLNEHKDSKVQAAELWLQITLPIRNELQTASVGSYITFGTYEQDNKASNGKEGIEWLVLDRKNDRILVISRYALDCKPYNTLENYVTWETCTLRTWLNKNFLNAAFSSAEQAMIPTMSVSADKNPQYSTYPGQTTQDQVFLLSITEAEKYFKTESVRLCKPTAYAIAQGAYMNSSGWGVWWLRSPGRSQNTAAQVSPRGHFDTIGHIVNFDGEDAVRPAMWIQFNLMDETAIPSSSTLESTLIPTVTATISPTATPAPTVTYQPLKQGSKGDDVITMKKRLQELGYFTAGASLSNQYNRTTTERVKLFQKANGLKQTGVADEATLQLLFSDDAKKNPD